MSTGVSISQSTACGVNNAANSGVAVLVFDGQRIAVHVCNAGQVGVAGAKPEGIDDLAGRCQCKNAVAVSQLVQNAVGRNVSAV